MESFPSAPCLDQWSSKISYLMADQQDNALYASLSPRTRLSFHDLKSPDVIRKEQEELRDAILEGSRLCLEREEWSESPLSLAALVAQSLPEARRQARTQRIEQTLCPRGKNLV